MGIEEANAFGGAGLRGVVEAELLLLLKERLVASELGDLAIERSGGPTLLSDGLVIFAPD